VTSRGFPLPNGKALSTTGVVAEGEAEVVARNVAALIRGAMPTAGCATGNFYAAPDTVVRLKRPGRRWHWGKVLVERTWFLRWL